MSVSRLVQNKSALVLARPDDAIDAPRPLNPRSAARDRPEFRRLRAGSITRCRTSRRLNQSTQREPPCKVASRRKIRNPNRETATLRPRTAKLVLRTVKQVIKLRTNDKENPPRKNSSKDCNGASGSAAVAQPH
ncbi:hypothetical protein OPT61_g6037 [Boeremia exigua]|uniref:Uncharacterized protein n=1 Tax=Boeremia exigua TaxID=749465 RepID=A0ACC2I827_9PLEO|nr:hypothetical protein OPT61_g6037 [Boeremia exigua]